MNRSAFLVMLGVSAGLGLGQNLYAPAAETPPEFGDRETDTPAPGSVESLSLFYVTPPEPHEIQKHDIVSILIDENSSVRSEQTLETEKESSTNATLGTILDPWELLELRLRSGGLTNLDLVDANGEREFSGEGEYERRDQFTARIAATVLEVKPNGTVVLEARKRIVKDGEEQVMVLSGRVRQEDVTVQNTILSSQIAELTLVMNNAGDVRDAANKGWITRVLDAVFSF